MGKTYQANKYEIRIDDLLYLLSACPVWIEKIKFMLSDDEGLEDGIRDINLHSDEDKIIFWFKKPVRIIAEDKLK